MTSEHEDWETAPLRSLCQETSTIDPVKIPDKLFDYVDVSAVSNDLWKIVSSTRHTGATAPSRARKLVRAQDVIFATVRPTLKRVALVPQDLDGQVVSTAFCVLRADPVKADPRFVYYSLLTEDFINRVSNLERGASYPAVTDNDVLGQEIYAPPLPEQRAITAVLLKIQAAVEVQEKIVATLKELKAATMAKLFREGLRGEPLKQTEIGEIPESWEVVQLGEHADIESSTVNFADLPKQYSEKPDAVHVLAMKVSDMNRPGNETCVWSAGIEFLASPDFVNDYAIPSGSIVFPKRGAAIGTNKKRLTTAPTVLDPNLIAVVPKGSIDRDFLFQWFLTFDIASLQDPGAIPQLNKKDLRPLPIPRPKSFEEQMGIARLLRSLDDSISLMRGRAENLRALFCSMLHLLMTGQVRVNHFRIVEAGSLNPDQLDNER